MKRADFVAKLDQGVLEAAIAKAEEKTSGEIRVMIVEEALTDALPAAQAAFAKLGMQATQHRNGVLFFLAPSSQTFAVVGDEGVHQRCGPAFWTELTEVMSGHFKLGHYTAGLSHGIARAGALLAEHFPRQSDDRNELPNTVVGPG